MSDNSLKSALHARHVTVPPEGPAAHCRTALALLGGLRALLTTADQRELLEAVSHRIWRAIQQLESK